MSISTCALREEGDLAAGDILLRVSVISIHALREEGDRTDYNIKCNISKKERQHNRHRVK